MPSYEFAAPKYDDLPCQDCDFGGQTWAYKADVIVRVRTHQTGGVVSHWLCWRCFDRWREIPEQSISLPPVSRRALAQMTCSPPTDEMRVRPFA